MNNPYADLISYSCQKAIIEWVSGHLSFDEAIEYANELCDKLSNTDEFETAVKHYFNNMIDIKEIGENDNEQTNFK